MAKLPIDVPMAMPSVEDLVADIDARAAKLNLSRAEILRRSGVTNATFYNWQTGDNSPRLETIEKIHEVLREAEGG